MSRNLGVGGGSRKAGRERIYQADQVGAGGVRLSSWPKLSGLVPRTLKAVGRNPHTAPPRQNCLSVLPSQDSESAITLV